MYSHRWHSSWLHKTNKTKLHKFIFQCELPLAINLSKDVVIVINTFQNFREGWLNNCCAALFSSCLDSSTQSYSSIISNHNMISKCKQHKWGHSYIRNYGDHLWRQFPPSSHILTLALRSPLPFCILVILVLHILSPTQCWDKYPDVKGKNKYGLRWVDGHCSYVLLYKKNESIYTAGMGLYIQWINFEYTKDKFKISSNSNSLFIFWIYLKFILQFHSILFSAYI